MPASPAAGSSSGSVLKIKQQCDTHLDVRHSLSGTHQQPDPRTTARRLRSSLARGQSFAPGSANFDQLEVWYHEARNLLVEAFGSGAHVVNSFEEVRKMPVHFSMTEDAWSKERWLAMRRGIDCLESSIRLLEAKAGTQETVTPAQVRPQGDRIFIGHGASSAWLELYRLLTQLLSRQPLEFNEESAAGTTNVARLEEMLASATFAFLVMTGEDDIGGGKLRARQNVIHEVGLFQGYLGFNRAIILLEDGCEGFSNIDGLTQIRFPKGRISAAFHDVRRALEKAGILQPSAAP